MIEGWGHNPYTLYSNHLYVYIYYIWVVHKMVRPQIMTILMLMDWLQGQSTGNHRSSYEIWVLPAIFPLNQSIDNGEHDD